MTSKKKRWLPLIGLGLAGCLVFAASDLPASRDLKKSRLNVIASESLFATVNQSDASASMQVWMRQVGKMNGFQFEAKIEITPSIGLMRQRLKEHWADLLVLDTPDFLVLADLGLVEVLAAGTIRGQLAASPYLLLTRSPLEGGQLSALRGKRIRVASRTKSNLGLIWLETLLAGSRLGRAGGFFSSVEAGYRANACVLPLFFGKIDACVVDSASWDSLQELNPQLGRLRVAAASEPLLEGLVAMPVEKLAYRSELIDSVLNLHKTAAGEELVVAFRTGPVIRVEGKRFDSVRSLTSRYRRLAGEAETGPGRGTGKERH